jgi:hypothetical protein
MSKGALAWSLLMEVEAAIDAMRSGLRRVGD